MIMKKPVKYFVVDAFTESDFKGNPAAVCFFEGQVDAFTEFHLPMTCFLTPINGFDPLNPPCFLEQCALPLTLDASLSK
ncbi:unnamed protein product [Eruca vesicaria subsp. sativa]|uniref:Uncharacterized protein n=1 Tax=Eruca vesicaria subsp. sativa TaxID=29727 RepID=A0ABC8IUH0_ERUVS|nr:unnamed protein product [Eruca vesicaria subsp. sativa]